MVIPFVSPVRSLVRAGPAGPVLQPRLDHQPCMFADLLADTGHITDLEAILSADPIPDHLAKLLAFSGPRTLHEAGADLFVPGLFTGVLLPRPEAVAELGAGTCSLSLRPGGQCERRDDDQDQESTECYLSYHGVSTPGQTGKGRKGPESPVSTGTWAGDIKPFLEREATCMRRDTLPGKGGTPGVLEPGKDPDDQESTSLARER